MKPVMNEERQALPLLLSIVAPFYNESAGISHFISTLFPVLDQIPNTRWEVVCVDDGSKDDTLARLVALTQQEPRLRVLELSRNFGKEAALTAGLDAALGAAVIPIDADLQDPPELISDMVKSWRNGAEVVLARRVDRASDHPFKRQTALGFYRLHNRISRLKLPENVGDFRLMDRTVVDALKQLPERQRFMKGLFAWLGFKTTVIDYVRAPRAAGKTSFSVFSLWNFALEGFTSFSTLPLRVWTYLGTLTAGLSILYALYILIQTLVSGRSVPGYASLFVAISFFGSVQLVSVGVLGEYIGRIYIESKQRPIYIIRKIYKGNQDS